MNLAFPDSCLVQFAKAPRPGRVKTRLQSVLGVQGCIALHRALVEHVFATLQSGKIAHQELWCSENDPYFSALADPVAVPVRYQQGSDLGERMSSAFADRLAHYRKVVLIGSDCPGLNAEYLKEAMRALDEEPVVLGPAEDGGYVLIGLAEPLPALFRDVPWGSAQVLEVTRARLREVGKGWRELKILPDIDRPGDLRHLVGIEKLHFFSKN
ncbi:MAG: glycosyltransferase [Gammaproteobacteria bacterium]|nr:MAG: glycosyltransferase [Gammaproteobacteria bacterium]